MWRTASALVCASSALFGTALLSGDALADAPHGDVPDEQEDGSGETLGLVLLIGGSIGMGVGAVLMVVGAELEEDPTFPGATGSIPSIGRSETPADTTPQEPDTSAHDLTVTGAVVFLASAAVGTVGGLMRWDWSDDNDVVQIRPYVTVGGGGVAGSF